MTAGREMYGDNAFVRERMRPYTKGAGYEIADIHTEAYRTMRILEDDVRHLELLLDLERSSAAVAAGHQKSGICEWLRRSYYYFLLNSRQLRSCQSGRVGIPAGPDPFCVDKLCECNKFRNGHSGVQRSQKFILGKKCRFLFAIDFRTLRHPAQLWASLVSEPHWNEISAYSGFRPTEFDQIFNVTRDPTVVSSGVYYGFECVVLDKFDEFAENISKRDGFMRVDF
jgi:hypothetical protein